ncbi:uncharacterized protein LOC115632034 isoform X1 [Scaptodrosophila lebanonensis]|uniref:Uncharacterized protein LOC115632034 isoform X1 n=1 Tax=Drosophila lebanonensis TaxID=7225 RepID=A0A6J2UA36_DROLE|nr:uncharacterized protein LOC115632034 isoform X1 [Scaptodrosophila lebanonensis]
MDSVKSFFANSNKENNLGNRQQQNGLNAITGRWPRWNSQLHAADASSGKSAIKNINQYDPKRKDSDNYFYIMWRA